MKCENLSKKNERRNICRWNGKIKLYSRGDTHNETPKWQGFLYAESKEKLF